MSPCSTLKSASEVVLFMPEGSGKIVRICDCRVLEPNQVFLSQRLALMGLAQQLDKAP